MLNYGNNWKNIEFSSFTNYCNNNGFEWYNAEINKQKYLNFISHYKLINPITIFKNIHIYFDKKYNFHGQQNISKIINIEQIYKDNYEQYIFLDVSFRDRQKIKKIMVNGIIILNIGIYCMIIN
jgi:hypothetical protein